MELNLVLSFFGASLLLIIMPGPDNIFVLTESLTNGHRNGIAISLGLVSGILIHTIAAATGVSIIIQQSAMAFSTIKYFGAAYLFYLAYQAMKDKKSNVEVGAKEKSEKSFFQLVRTGFLMNVLNPKVSLFFIALLPQFVSKSEMNVTLQMIILGLIFMVQALIFFYLLSILSGKFSKYLNNAKFWKYTKWTKVGVLSLLGLTLLLARK